MYTCTYICLHTYINIYTYTYIYLYSHTHTLTHTHTHTHRLWDLASGKHSISKGHSNTVSALVTCSTGNPYDDTSCANLIFTGGFDGEVVYWYPYIRTDVHELMFQDTYIVCSRVLQKHVYSVFPCVAVLMFQDTYIAPFREKIALPFLMVIGMQITIENSKVQCHFPGETLGKRPRTMSHNFDFRSNDQFESHFPGERLYRTYHICSPLIMRP